MDAFWLIVVTEGNGNETEIERFEGGAGADEEQGIRVDYAGPADPRSRFRVIATE